MARDLIIRPDDRVVTLVHDEPNLKVASLIVLSEGLYAVSDEGKIYIGPLTDAFRKDLLRCERCYVVLMDGHAVLKTTEARLHKELKHEEETV